MAIETQCPHCHKGYRLKDELAGKRVTCGNPDCRQAFVVSGKAATNGSAKVAKPAARPPVDAEALAAAALADDADAALAVPVDQRTVNMTCAICDHKWDVPWAMQGKNVLCPECRHRQKVPEQKQAKVDWRDPKAGRPSMARVEKLDDVVSAGDASMVSGETLRKHVIKEEIEPRPAWHYAAGAAGALTVVALAVFAVLSLRQSGKEGARDDYMAKALADVRDAKETALSPKQAPLFRAALQIAAGEFALRKDEAAGLKEAITHFAKARQELESLPGSPGRDVLFSELALAQANLGGTDEQIGRDVRARWTPQAGGAGRPRVKETVFDVQKQLLQTLTAMRREDRAVARDVRFDTLRRLARDLARRGHPEVLSQSLVAQGFFPPEVPEAEAEVAVETLKVTGDLARARTAGEQLVQTVKANPKPDPVPVTAQVLWMVVEPPITTGTKFASEPSASGEVTDPVRQVYVTLALLRNKSQDEALNLASRPGTPDSRARALARVAEWSDDPGPAVQAAQQVVAEVAANPKGPTISDYTLVRLARQAGRAKQPADAIIKAIGNDDYQAWAKAEALQAELATTEGQPADEARAALPDSPRDYRVGHAWARMALARQAARVGQGKALELGLDRWGAGTFRPFGYAGLALGLQDKALR